MRDGSGQNENPIFRVSANDYPTLHSLSTLRLLVLLDTALLLLIAYAVSIGLSFSFLTFDTFIVKIRNLHFWIIPSLVSRQ